MTDAETIVKDARDGLRNIEWEDYPRSVRVAARLSDSALSQLLIEIQRENHE